MKEKKLVTLFDFRIDSLCFYTKKIFLISMISSFIPAFVSCNKTIETIDIVAEQTVFVSAKTSVNFENTRSEAASVQHGQAVVFNNGLLIFSHADGTIEKVCKVDQGVTGGGIIGINDLTSDGGVAIEGISTDCTVVDFFANIPPGIEDPVVDSDITLFRAAFQGVTSIADNSGGVHQVGIYGTGQINPSNRKAVFSAIAIASRLEIAKFKREISEIESFDIEGIFINNFYYRADLTGITDDDDIIYYTSTSLFEENGEPYYFSSYKGITFDFNKTTYLGQESSGNYVPLSSGNVWAYNIYSGEVPHIVIKLANVTGTTELINTHGGIDPFASRTYWYITVTGLAHNGTRLQKIQQGCVYFIRSIEVSINTLNPGPEPKDDEVEVKAEVSIIPWITEEISTTLPHLPW